MIGALKKFGKHSAIRMGGLDVFHRLMHRETLTVLMFHRVLPPEQQINCDADPEYTISTHQFQELLKGLARQYQFVSLADVLAAKAHQSPLPNYAMLLTFDDGWMDNFQFALPILANAKIPWVVFVATDPVLSEGPWWQEVILCAVRTGRFTYQDLWQRAASAEDEAITLGEPTLDLLLKYGRLQEDRRQEILAAITANSVVRSIERNMLDIASLRAMHSAGVDIGIHGASHLPLTGLRDPAHDLAVARDFLRSALSPNAVRSLSFPHGRYDLAVVRATRKLDIPLIFTSDAVINSCPDGWIETDVLGRIPIAGTDVSNLTGGVDALRWKPWLYLRPRASKLVD